MKRKTNAEINEYIKTLQMNRYSMDHQDPDHLCELCNYWRTRFDSTEITLLWAMGKSKDMGLTQDKVMKEKGHS